MLDAYIIDELRRHDRERRRYDERPTLEIPLPDESEHPEQTHSQESDVERGVAIIDFSI